MTPQLRGSIINRSPAAHERKRALLARLGSYLALGSDSSGTRQVNLVVMEGSVGIRKYSSPVSRSRLSFALLPKLGYFLASVLPNLSPRLSDGNANALRVFMDRDQLRPPNRFRKFRIFVRM
jgi:hypothetical protein